MARAAVVICCYNQAQFLAEAIRSVCDQGPVLGQLIIVDDGSSDETGRVAAQWPSALYLFQRNSGLSAARNFGLTRVREPFVLFLDADDRLRPGALDAAVACLSRCPGAAFTYGSYQRIDATGRVLSTHAARPMLDGAITLLLGNAIAMHGAVLYDTALLSASGGFDTTLEACEDYDVYLRLARRHAFQACEAVIADYRQHPVSLSRQRLTMIATARRVINRHAKGWGNQAAAVAAARAGRRFMTNHFAEALVRDLLAGRTEGGRRRSYALLARDAIRHPLAAIQASIALTRGPRGSRS